MNFLIPGAFGLMGLLAVIVIFYLLKLRRQERTVSSVYLWQRMVQDREASAPWQKLHFNWLMLLQLLFLALLIFSLARPFSWEEGVSGQAVIFILDSSASMSATDAAPTRLEAARKRARQFINDLPVDARVTVIEAGSETLIRLTSSQDRRQALQAVDAVQPGAGSADLGMALELASAVASREPNTQIVVLSDGRSPLPEHLAIRGQLNYLPVGISGENQAISLLTVEPSTAGGWTVFAQASNYGAQEAQRRLEIYADDRLINAYDLKIPAGGQQSVVLPDLPPDARHVEARLAGSDILALDDKALTVVRAQHSRRVALVSNGNLFLKTALHLLPGIELVEVDPAENQNPGEVDLTILDGVLPSALPARGSLWFIAPPARTDLFTVSGTVQEPVLRLFDPQDPLVRDLSPAGIHLMDAHRIPLPDWAVPVMVGDLAGENVPLLFRGEPDGRRVAVLTFNLAHSDLPLNVAFPVLCANIVDWLTPGSAVDLPASILSGETFTLPESVREAVVIRPDGSQEQASLVENRLTVSDTNQPGYYTVRWSGDQQAEFAVNLYSPQESDLKPAGTLEGLTAQGGENTGASMLARREWWRWLVLPALLLLMLEWMIFQRGGLMRLRDWLGRQLKHLHLKIS